MSALKNSAASLRVVTVLQKPFVMYDSKSGKFYGFCIDLLDLIRETLPFEYTIREVKEYGNMDNNGNWNGMINELINNKADITLGTLSVMADRENVIDFTIPYYEPVGLTIMMQKRQPKTSLFRFMKVLEDDVWVCILIAYFLTALLIWMFDRFSPYSYQNNREKYKNSREKRVFTIQESLWFSMTSLTPQGGGEAPKHLSGRLVSATWWLFGFIILASYTANLSASLTIARLHRPIESLDQLAAQYRVEYSCVQNSDTCKYFQKMADIEDRFYYIWKDISLNNSLSGFERSKLAVWDYPVSDKYSKIFSAMVKSCPKTLDEGVKRVQSKKSQFALIADAIDVKYLTITNCDLKQVGEEFGKKPYAIAVQQGSPLKDQLNKAILVLLNERKLEKLKDKWWNKNPERKTCDKEQDKSDGLGIQNVGGAFIVAFVGIALAFLTLIIEFYYYRCWPKKKKMNPEVTEQVVTKLKSLDSAKSARPVAFTLQPAPTQDLN